MWPVLADEERCCSLGQSPFDYSSKFEELECNHLGHIEEVYCRWHSERKVRHRTANKDEPMKND